MNDNIEKLNIREEIEKIVKRLIKEGATHCTKDELIDVLKNSE